jgi:hypothetical protein
MNLTDAEVFLLMWAVIATVIAGLYAQKANHLGEAVKAMMFALGEVAKGNAEVSLKGDDTIQIKKIKD